MLNELQKKTAQAIVNIFETGRVLGDYAAVTFHPADPGHLTYGRSQTTLASGNLFLLIKTYCEASQAEFASRLRKYLGPLAQRDTALDHNDDLRDCLSKAGNDPVMRDAQDQFFERAYWIPSVSAAHRLQIQTALGTTVVYDSHVHGSWKAIRDLTNRQGLPSSRGEQAWVEKYIKNRRAWLAGHTNNLLHRTVYRMDAFQRLLDDNAWDLALPLRIRGVEIIESVLAPPVRVSAQSEEDERILRLETPFLEGKDVREVQKALNQKGIDVIVDSIFGERTARAVFEFQSSNHLLPDGIVGPVTRAQLGI